MTINAMAPEVLLRKHKSLVRELRRQSFTIHTRIALLGGSTTNEVTDFLELLLLQLKISPTFYQSEYNRYFEESVVDPSALVNFGPDIVIIFTSSINIQAFPPLQASESDIDAYLSAERGRFASIWNSLQKVLGCLVIQNNFELPGDQILGNLDCVLASGHTRFINRLNEEFAREAETRPKLLMNDLNSITGTVGGRQFHDPRRWFRYKLISSPLGSLEIAKSIAAIIASVYGRSRKCLVLDLDNTLWGGVIGDDGPDKIQIGKETPEAEGYTEFQQYCLRLRERGVLLAVCSKNEEAIARQGFEHPDSILKTQHFSCFKANWEPKHENIKAIAAELNIGLDSMVFVDDNPAERNIVAAQLPMVAVPDVGSDVSEFSRVLQNARYFEPVGLSSEDLNRAQQYESNALRTAEQGQFASYDEYLDSLEMTAEIEPFRAVYLERITQLINKTNQFNLTTRRYTLADVEKFASDPHFLTLYGRLSDKFGDNGLITVVIGRCEGQVVHIDLWLMSCRVLKRGMESAMLDALAGACQQRGINQVYGYYTPTAKNSMVREHYAQLGFHAVETSGEGSSVWKLELEPEYRPRNSHILIKELVHD